MIYVSFIVRKMKKKLISPYPIYIKKLSILKELIGFFLMITFIAYKNKDFGDFERIIFLPLLFLGIIMIINHLQKLFQTKPELIITHEGIHFYKLGFLAWRDIDKIYIRNKKWWHYFVNSIQQLGRITFCVLLLQKIGRC